MSHFPHVRPGDWLYDCQRCGYTVWTSETRREWTGLRVCHDCWDPKHPQISVKGVKDNQKVPFSNHPPDVFQTVPVTGDDL